MAVCMKFRFIPANTGWGGGGGGSRTGARVVQDLTNRMKGRSYMCI